VSEFYDAPCSVCGEKIKHTNKRGRPPKKHPDCATGSAHVVKPVKPQVKVEAKGPKVKVPVAAEETETDPDLKTVEEFLKAPVKDRSRRAPIVQTYSDDRVSKLARFLAKGDRLIIKKAIYTVRDAKQDYDHTVVRLEGYPLQSDDRSGCGKLRIISDGMVFVQPS